MSERYTRVFELAQNLYTEGSPVLIAAGALLKDNVSGNMLAQVKLKNLTDKRIKAAKIVISTFDTAGQPLGEDVTYEYLDLEAGRDEDFGQKVPVRIENRSVRAFSINVSEIIYHDNSTWVYSGGEWSPVKEARRLTSVFDNIETAKQFKMENGSKCEYEVTEDRDLWICSCGKLNKKDSAICFNCGCSMTALRDYDLGLLEEKRDARLADEAIKEKERQQKIKKNSIIAGIILVIIIIISASCSAYNEKAEKYDKAVSMLSSYDEDDIEKGLEALLSMGNFKESKEEIYKRGVEITKSTFPTEKAFGMQILLNIPDYKDSKEIVYNTAVEIMPENYDVSIQFLTLLGDYKDSKEKILEAPYVAGENFFSKGYYSSAYDAYKEAGSYKDSEEKAKEALLYKLIMETKATESFYVSYIVEELGVKMLTGEEITKSIVGQWIVNREDPMALLTINENGTFDRRRFYKTMWRDPDENPTAKWSVTEDKISFVNEENSKKNTDTATEYTVLALADGVFARCNPTTNVVVNILISTDSEFGAKFIEKHPVYRIQE